MNRAMMTSAVSMNAIQNALDTVSNNLSNMDTTGYKQRSAAFSSLLEQNYTDQPDANLSLNRNTPLGLRLGTGSRVASTKMDLSDGAIQQTGRSLDVALTQPNQFFTVQTETNNGSTETRYTRNGAFYAQPSATNPNQLNLVTENGAFVLDQNGKPIHIPAGANVNDIRIDQTGTVQETLSNGTTQPYGKLGLVSISKPQLLTSAGDTTYTLPNLASLNTPSGNVWTRVTPQNGDFETGALESSNVNLTDGMTQLTQLQRSYQLNAKAVQVSDNMMNLINNIHN